MTCDNCKDLRIDFKIRSSSELKKAMQVAKENVADGTISLLTKETGDWSTPFAEISLEAVMRDDIVHYVFNCTSCGQKFKLHAETYHGRGGAWEPID
jgi:hypothetical protein